MAYPNYEYTPTANTPYLRLSIIPALTEQSDLGTDGLNNNEGIAQVDVFAVSNKTYGPAYTKADQLAEHFKRGTKLVNGGVTVTITGVEINPALASDGWYQLPVSINYQAYTEN